MKLSVLIPTYRRPSSINRCLAKLAAQHCSAPFEIIVGLDGPEDTTPPPLVPPSIERHTQITRMDRIGLIAVRKKLLDLAIGEIVLWINDDADPAPGLLEAHLAVHRDHAPSVVAGSAHWKPIERPDLFDMLVQRSDLIFFQQKSARAEPTVTSYRNCFGLNMSFPRQLAQGIGGLHALSESYGYEDIELAYRLEHAGAQIWHAPQALVIHDHRYRPPDVCRREYLLGRSAWQYAHLNPAFATELFKRDLRESAELRYFTASLTHELRDAQRIEQSFRSLAGMPPDLIDQSDNRLLDLLAEHWVLLKRYLWRWGVLDGANGVEVGAVLANPLSCSLCPYS